MSPTQCLRKSIQNRGYALEKDLDPSKDEEIYNQEHFTERCKQEIVNFDRWFSLQKYERLVRKNRTFSQEAKGIQSITQTKEQTEQ